MINRKSVELSGVRDLIRTVTIIKKQNDVDLYQNMDQRKVAKYQAWNSVDYHCHMKNTFWYFREQCKNVKFSNVMLELYKIYHQLEYFTDAFTNKL